MLTSLPVWAIIAAHFGTNWCIYVMFTELPIFLTRSLGYRVDEVYFSRKKKIFFYRIFPV
jgi:ACS family sodium-dependent inorganic phosphate cotransporter